MLTNEELRELMTFTMKAWPSGPWDEGTERIWMLEFHTIEFDVAGQALRDVHRIHRSTFAPPWPA